MANTMQETTQKTTLDPEEIAQDLLDELKPKLNEALPGYIQDAGLDPWKEVASGSETLGKINLVICTAKVKAKYEIKNMEGLSSMVVDTMDLESLDTSSLPVAAGDVKIKASLGSNLKAKVTGKITAECGGLKEKVEISGTVKAKNVTGKIVASITADIGEQTATLDAMDTDSLQIDYDEITVDIDSLGIFNEFLGFLDDLIDELFGSTIKSLLVDLLKPVLDETYAAELPVSIDY